MMHVLSLSLSLFSFPGPRFNRRSRRRRAMHTCKNIFSLSLSLYLRRYRHLVTWRTTDSHQRSPKRAARTTWRLCQRRGLCPSALSYGGFDSAPFRPVPVSFSLRRSRASRSLPRRGTLTFPLGDAPLSSFLVSLRATPLRSARLRFAPLRSARWPRTRASNYRLLKSGIHNIGQVESGASGGSNIDGLSAFTYTRLCRDGRRRARTALLPSTSIHTMHIYLSICMYIYI